jgi:hypothetical protein
MIDVPEARLFDVSDWTVVAEPFFAAPVDRSLAEVAPKRNCVSLDVSAVAIWTLLRRHPPRETTIGGYVFADTRLEVGRYNLNRPDRGRGDRVGLVVVGSILRYE